MIDEDVLADEDLREQLRCEHDHKGEYDLKDEDGLRDILRDEDNLTNAADFRV